MKPDPMVKVARTVPIPDDFRAFLEDVQRRIEAGDEWAVEPSDDGLNCECAFGGLAPDGVRYTFVYLPRGTPHPAWYLAFKAAEIERIAAGAITKLRIWACRDASCGTAFTDADGLCLYCDYVNQDGRRTGPPR